MNNIVLIHGGPGLDSSYFGSVFEENLAGYNFIKPDFNLNKFDNIDSQSLELENLIRKYDPAYVICHSFGAILFLYYLKQSKNFSTKALFTNWVYDYSWLDEFKINNKSLYENDNSNNIHESMIHYNPIYFEDSQLGLKILGSIKYNDSVCKRVTSDAMNLNLESTLFEHYSQIKSLHSKEERLIPKHYIENITNKFKIENYYIDGKSHFPFIEYPDSYFKILKEIL